MVHMNLWAFRALTTFTARLNGISLILYSLVSVFRVFQQDKKIHIHLNFTTGFCCVLFFLVGIAYMFNHLPFLGSTLLIDLD